MSFQPIHKRTGADVLQTWLGFAALVLLIGLAALLTKKAGVIGIVALLIIVPGILIFRKLLWEPVVSVYILICVAFFNNGTGRYVPGPWGLLVDIVAVFALLSVVLFWRQYQWSHLRNGLFWWATLWYLVVVMALFNPEGIGFEPWFYAMRAMGFYQLIVVVITMLTVEKPEQYGKLIQVMFICSVIGTFWGLKQQFFELDRYEKAWLYGGGYFMTHILHGVLRVFSFYSDAGQFGASQAFFFLAAIILMVGPFSVKQRLIFFVFAILSLIGFSISGTRGAIAVPAVGGMGYLLLSRNVKVFTLGSVVAAGVYYFLKYTFAFQGVESVRRMRTALDPQDASLLVRIENQKIFAHYLQDRPFGAGMGTVGYWGSKFAPDSFLASMPTDSYFVKVWVELGVVGLAIHLFMFGYFVGRGGYICWNIKDPALRQRCLALFAGFLGILMASYGNQVYAQTPTSIVCPIALAMVFKAPYFDKLIAAQKAAALATARSASEEKPPGLT